MNSFFCSVGKDFTKDIETAPNPLLNRQCEMNKKKRIFNFRTINIEKVRDAIGKFKATKSFGIDHISSYFLEIAEFSRFFIFNTSLETSVLPDIWKVARVTPIFKDGDKTDKSN